MDKERAKDIKLKRLEEEMRLREIENSIHSVQGRKKLTVNRHE